MSKDGNGYNKIFSFQVLMMKNKSYLKYSTHAHAHNHFKDIHKVKKL